MPVFISASRICFFEDMMSGMKLGRSCLLGIIQCILTPYSSLIHPVKSYPSEKLAYFNFRLLFALRLSESLLF